VPNAATVLSYPEDRYLGALTKQIVFKFWKEFIN